MSIESGFILLYESIIDSEIVGFEHPYSKAEAWIWMLLEACRKPEGRQVYRKFGNKERLVFEPYGCLCHSERFLQKAWGWSSRKKVETFLNRLEHVKKVSRELSQQITVINICNFETYQNRRASKRASKEPARSQQGASKEPNYNTLTRKHVNKLKDSTSENPIPKHSDSTIKKQPLSDASHRTTPSRNSYSENFLKFWSAMRSDMKHGKKAAFKYYKASVKNDQDHELLNKAYQNYLKTRKVRNGFVMNGSTFMNNWKDYLEYRDINKPKNQKPNRSSQDDFIDSLPEN